MTTSLLSIKFVPIKDIQINPDSIMIAPSLSKRWRLKNNQTIQICIGRRRLSVQVQIEETNPGEIQIPEQLLLYFSLPIHSHRFTVHYDDVKQSLTVGPIIGMVTNFKLEEYEEPNFRSVHSFCEELEKGVKELGGFFYVFSYKDFSKEGVKGYYYSNDKWELAILPLPDVIYNRIHSRKLELSGDILPFQENTLSLNIPFFNERFFSKWEVNKFLCLEDHMLPFLPEMKVFSKENLITMTKQYEIVFIKPIHGSQGRNIIKITNENNFFKVQTSTNDIKNNLDKRFTIDEILRNFHSLLNKGMFIIQQGVSLINYHERLLDFRVLCHRNAQNLWETTSLVARISAQQQFVSNIARGGELMKPAIALAHSFNKVESIHLIELMKELAIEAAAILSTQTTGIIGELGIDLGIDDVGKLWIIEINSKPSKNFEDSSMKIRPSAKAIIRYCTVLAFDSAIEKEV